MRILYTYTSTHIFIEVNMNIYIWSHTYYMYMQLYMYIYIYMYKYIYTCIFWTVKVQRHLYERPPLSTEERDSLWVETAFAENPELAWERGRGSVKNEVLPKIFRDQRLSLER